LHNGRSFSLLLLAESTGKMLGNRADFPCFSAADPRTRN
jgi:hypothetical protein